MPAKIQRRVPGPRGLDSFRAMRHFLQDPLDYLVKLQRYGDVVRTGMGPVTFHTIYNPLGLRRAFVDQPNNYTKRGVIDDLVPVLGDGLLSSEGAAWKKRRAELSPGMAPRALDAMLSTIDETVQQTLLGWSSGQAINASEATAHLALQIVGRTLFDVDLSSRASDVSLAVEKVSRLALRRSKALVKLPLGLPTPANIGYRRAIDLLRKHTDAIIAEASTRSPFMTMLSNATGSDTEALRNEVITFLLAGHETTATTMAWTIGHLARDIALQDRAREEARQFLAQNELTIDAYSSLELIDAIISEALRLYPPGWMLLRRAEMDDEVMGYVVSRNSFVVAPVYALHRNPECWPEPERFDPSRFIGRDQPRRDPLMYVPFGLGPRRCIGERFARLEMCVFLARLVSRFSMTPIGELPCPETLTTLRPREPVRVRIE